MILKQDQEEQIEVTSMELFVIERKVDSFQKGMIGAMTNVWLQENEMRKALDQERAQRQALERRLAKIEAAFDQHNRIGDYCPHTGR